MFIEDEQGRLLLLQQAAERKGFRWCPPAGGMEAHEDPMMAAIREAKEEIDVDVELTDVIGIYVVDRSDSASGLAFVFRGKITSGEITPKEGEIMNYRFFEPQEIQALTENGQLYKPEYNTVGVRDWIEGETYAIGVLKRR